MSKTYFLKSGVRNRISYRNGEQVKFVPVADGRGLIELDSETDAQRITDLQEYVTRKIGGVSAIDEATYADLKKNPALTREERMRTKARVYELQTDPYAKVQQDNAKLAKALAGASPAVAPSVVDPAVARGSSGLLNTPKPVSRGKPMRTNKSVQKASQTPPEDGAAPVAVSSTPEPSAPTPAAAGQNESPGTTETP